MLVQCLHFSVNQRSEITVKRECKKYSKFTYYAACSSIYVTIFL